MSEYDDLLARVRAGDGAAAPANNEFDTLLAQVRGQDKSVVQSNLNLASFGQPASEVQKQQIARQLKDALGEDWSPKAINPEEAQRRLKVAEYDHVLQASPKLAQKYLDTGYAERTFDDIHPLAGVEKAATAFGDFMGNRWSALKSSAYSASAGGMGLIRPITDTAAALIPSNVTENAAEWVANYQSGTQKIADSMLQDKGDFVWNSFDQGLQSLGMNLAMMPAAILTGNPLMTLLPMSAVTGGSEYGKARDAGVAIPQAMTYATSQAAIEYVTEMMPVTKFLGDLKAGAPFHKMLMNQIAKEVPGEQVATLLQDLNEWAVINPDKPFTNYLAERPSAAAQTLIATIVGVGGQVSTVKGAEVFVDAMTGKKQSFADPMVKQATAAQRALEAEQHLTGLIDAATQTASISRDPGAVQELIAAATEDGASEIFINARQFATVFNQSAIEVAQRMGVEPAALDSALTANSDIVVSLDTLAAAVAQDQVLRPIIEHARVDPSDMSPVDARLWQSQQGEAFKAEAEQVLARRQVDDAYRADVAQVHESLKTQLAQANRFAPRVNDQYASMVRDFYVTMAERSGMKVSEFAAKYPLKVVAEGTGGAALQQDGNYAQPVYNQSKKVKTDEKTLDLFADAGALDAIQSAQPELSGDVQPAEALPRGTFATRTELDVDGDRKLGASQVTSPAEAAQALAYLGRGAVERFDALVTDSEGKPLAVVGSTKGAIAQTSVYPSTIVGEAFRIPGAANIWFAHNHPSGRAEFSGADRNMEKVLREAFRGSRIEPRGFFAIASETDGRRAWVHVDAYGETYGDISPDTAAATTVPVMQRVFVSTGKLGESVRSPSDAKRLAVDLSGGESGLILTDAQNTPVAFVPVLPDNTMPLRFTDGMDAIYKALSVANAAGAFVVSRNNAYTMDQIRNMTALLGGVDVNVMDVMRVTDGGVVESAAERGEDFKGNRFNQGEGNRGSFDPASNTIGLLENADRSTFLHESGHFFLEVMADLASQPNAPAAVRDDFWKLLNWFGLQGEPDATPIEQWNRMTLDEKRQYHEQFARGFEAYLFEGKAPSIEARGMFAKFRAWLTNVYQSLKDLNVTLTDEVRGVMDRMIASEQAIQTAEAVRNFAPIFQTAEQAGMTAEEWAQYQAEGSEATSNAVDEVQARSIRDLRWLANAKAKKLKELQATAKEVRAQVRAEVAREVMSQPVYQAWQFLSGKDPAKAPKDAKADPKAIDPLTDDLLVAMAKLGGMDLDQAIKEWGVDPADARAKADNAGGKRLVLRKDGEPLDSMGELLAQYGYVQTDENGKHDMADFEEKFFDAIKGHEVMSDWSENMIPTEDPMRFMSLENTPHGKLNTDILRAMYGEESTAPWRLLSALRMTSPEGFHPNDVAGMFGYTSGDELVRRIAVAEDPKVVIEGMTDQRMLEEFGDLSGPKEMELAAERAIHNEVRARMLTRELNALRKATGKAPIMLKAARLHADTWLARQKVKDAIKHGQHVAAEGRSAKAAEAALKTGDTEAAAIHKRDEVLNNQLARGALRAGDEVRKAVAYLKKFDKEGTRKAIDSAYRDQIDQLLERFDLRQVSQKALEKRASLATWLTAQEELGLDPVVDQRLVEDAQRQHYSTMTLEEFRGLVDTVESIEHMGRLKTRLLTAKNKREFAKVIADLEASIITNANRDVQDRNPVTKLDKVARAFIELGAHHRKFASLVREMDGGKDGGPMWEYLVRAMNEAGDREATMRAAMSQQLSDLFKGIKHLKLSAKTFLPEINTSLRREEVIMLALNSGNRGNVQRLLDGGVNNQVRAMSQQQLSGILNRLSKEEWDFVEGVWTLVESNRPAIAAQEKALTGVEPQWVEPDPFTLADGRVIRGGYFPAKYNGLFSTRSAELESVTDLRQQMKGAMGNSSTRNGYTKQRAEEVSGRPLKLDLNVIAQHINEVSHRLAWQAWLIDARRILKAPAVENAIKDHYGVAVLNEMKDHLKAIAEGDQGASDAMGRFAGYLRTGATIVGMGWNMMTALAQPIGLTQSIERVGAKWVGLGLKTFIAHPFESSANVQQVSEFMRNRAMTINREINDVLNTVRSEKLTKVEASYFILIQKFQQMVDVPTWLGAYEKAIAEGNNDARALALADQAVLDSQGGGTIKDLAGIQRGNEYKKLFTNFYSFFNTLHQRMAENHRATDYKDPLSVGKAAANYLLLFVLPTVWMMALKEALRGDGEDDDELLAKYAKEQLSFLLGTTILGRELSGAISSFTGYQGPAGLRFIAEFYKFVKQTAQGEVDMPWFKSLMNTAGLLLHLPLGQVARMVEGTDAYMEDAAGPQAILVGPPIKN